MKHSPFLLKPLVLAVALLASAAAFAFAGQGADRQGEQAIPAADPEDVKSVDAIMEAVYDVISGPAGPRNWDRFRSLFAPGARLIAVSPSAPAGLGLNGTVEDYITRAGANFNTAGFYEKEIARKSERFGNIVHAFSTYAAFRTATDETPFVRGINSFQLVTDGSRWYVVTIFWQAESPDFPIPEEYLPQRDEPYRH